MLRSTRGHPHRPAVVAATLCFTMTSVADAQTHRTNDSVINRMWQVGVENSHTELLAQTLMDSIGPRLAGSTALAASQDWLVDLYQSWGVTVRKEEYGTWQGWRQGYLHVDMTSPRVQTLDAELLAWSPGTGGPLEGDVIALAELAAAGSPDTWRQHLAGKWVLETVPEPTCRAPHEMEQNARPETVQRIGEQRAEAFAAFNAAIRGLGGRSRLREILNQSGALGIVTSNWSRGWGVNKVFSAWTREMPSFDLSCEDYSLLYRMAQRGQAPRIRVDADAELLDDVPQYNVVAELTGTELPDEYVILSAHLDSWHAGTGATDNGTGSIMMLEAMRILKETYPNPKRTILVGHWGPEEMGLTGSRAFTEDHADILDGIQVVFNQDNGTWAVERIEGQGILYSGQHIGRWIAAVPSEISDHITLEFPGAQNNRGSDHVAFLCHGVPAFRLQSPYDEYRQYTWHTNRDTYDKIVFDDLKENATLAAMLAYGASEDPNNVPRDQAILPIDPRTGEPRQWLQCGTARRSSR